MLNRFFQRLLNPLPMEETEQDYQRQLQTDDKPRITWARLLEIYDANPDDTALMEELRKRYDIVDEGQQ